MGTQPVQNKTFEEDADPRDFLVALKPEARLVICSSQTVEGHGFDQRAARLFARMAEGDSLSKASKKLPMAYSKAWQLVKDLETDFQIDLVNRDKGSRGYSLTEHGYALLRSYEAVQNSISKKARCEFATCVSTQDDKHGGR